MDPRTHERKSRANCRPSCDVMENPRIPESSASYQIGKARVTKLVKVVTDRAEKVLKQAEKNKDSATLKKSRESRRRR